MEQRMEIKDSCGRLIKVMIVKDNGDKEVKDFCGRLLGTYSASMNVTRDIAGRVIAYGDMSSAL